MSIRTLEADYVIVGAGAAGMAFADTLLSESDASMILVDRRQRAGGHWNDAYPFVRLHGPAAHYGVNSRVLGHGSSAAGGLHGLPGAAEICAYFDAVMNERLLPSGRVRFLPMAELGPDGIVGSRLGAPPLRVRALRKLVDATRADTRVPATHPAPFAVGEGVRCVGPHELPRLNEAPDGYVIIGAGKTAMDTAVWLLEHGVAPARIRWVRPREAWLLDRAQVQPAFDSFDRTVGAMAAEMEAARDAGTVDELFERLEQGGQLQRIDRGVKPTMFRCAIVSQAELAQLRRIQEVIRLGHVKAIESARIVLEHGEVPTSPRQLHIHCCADGIPQHPPQPIFQPGRIELQYVRRCAPSFSAALLAHLEATLDDDAHKNALSTPVPVPDVPLDWLRMRVLEARNARAWAASADLNSWLDASRLDAFRALIARGRSEGSPAQRALLERFRHAMPAGLAQLARLLAPSVQPAAQRVPA